MSRKDTRPSARERGYSSAWEKAASAYLKGHPRCVNDGQPKCKGGARHVDHIIPHEKDWSLFWDKSNWQPMCQPCHNRKTRAEWMAKRRANPAKYATCDPDGKPRDSRAHW